MISKFEQFTRCGRLGLKTIKKDSVIDFISSIPEMTVKAASEKNIVHGFCENGMIDKKVGMYPDFNQMLDTCQKEIKQEEFDPYLRSFPYLFEVIKNKGHIDDHVFEDLGFPKPRT